LEIEIMGADEDGDEVKTESIREEEPMEDIAVESEWEADETVQEQNEPLVESREDKPTREESNEEHCQWSQERLMLSQVVMTSMLKRIMRSEPREHEDVGIKDVLRLSKWIMRKVTVEFQERKHLKILRMKI